MIRSMQPSQVFTVSQVNRYTKRLLEADTLLAGLFIEGEISNFNAHGSGHLYFSLKDAGASLPAVMFHSHASSLAFVPRSGMKVIAFGRLSLYEKTGQYQFYAEFLEPAGIGGAHLAFQQLCEKLKTEGLFDEERKQPIPEYANKIAVITSPTGAAVQDIIKTARQRNPAVQLIIVPALVQGENAPQDLVRALREVHEWGQADIIIIGRGGGSAEDLAAFNDENLARTLAAATIPVISAVGHETDFTVCDFVADARAATPTAAAQMAVYDSREPQVKLLDMLNDLHYVMRAAITGRYAETKNTIQTLTRLVQTRLAHEQQNLQHKETLLEKVSPYAAFARGFAMVTDTKNKMITSPEALQPGDVLTLRWAEETIKVNVLE